MSSKNRWMTQAERNNLIIVLDGRHQNIVKEMKTALMGSLEKWLWMEDKESLSLRL